jgi:hypothetical protein
MSFCSTCRTGIFILFSSWKLKALKTFWYFVEVMLDTKQIMLFSPALEYEYLDCQRPITNLDFWNFSLFMARSGYSMVKYQLLGGLRKRVPILCNQLHQQFSMEVFEIFQTNCTHIENMHLTLWMQILFFVLSVLSVCYKSLYVQPGVKKSWTTSLAQG